MTNGTTLKTLQKWVSNSGYKKGLTIERKNSDENYCPENCTWATAKEQANNRRTTAIIEYKGETHSLAEWARLLGINRHTLWSRIHKQGWSVEKAFSWGKKKDGEDDG